MKLTRIFTGAMLCLGLFSAVPPVQAQCGIQGAVSCVGSNGQTISGAVRCPGNSDICCAPASACNESSTGINNFDLTFEELNQKSAPNFNSIGFIGQIIGGSYDGSTPGILSLALIFGGIVLLFMLVWGGFQMLSNPTNPSAMEAGRNRIMYAVVGFLLLFASFWIFEIIQTIFGLGVV